MRFDVLLIAGSILLFACAKKDVTPTAETAQVASSVSPKETKAIAEEAYIYAFPMLENYRTLYAQAIDKSAPGYRAPFNQLSHTTELLGPEFKDVVRPNNDTLYSFAWLNLRAQPVIITVPQTDGRYYSVQLVDLFTNNLGYIGTRATGGTKGSYLVAGPQWGGAKPGNVTAVIQSDSSFVFCLVRIQVNGPDDIAAAVALQDTTHLTAMNVFMGRSRVPVAAGITFPKYDPRKAKSAGFVDYLNFFLTLVRVPKREDALMKRFALIGIKPGMLSASLSLNAETREAVDAGVGAALIKISKAANDVTALKGVTGRANTSWGGAVGIFGSPEVMQGRYLVRAAAAMVGLYGNDAEEAYYPIANTDASGDPLEGTHTYVMHFEKDELPPVDAFWSMTMYSLPNQLMVANPIDRYSIGDRSKLRYEKDGSLTLYIQQESPGKKRESNWLPAPDGSFSLQFRMYLPEPEAVEAPLYLPPPVQLVR